MVASFSNLLRISFLSQSIVAVVAPKFKKQCMVPPAPPTPSPHTHHHLPPLFIPPQLLPWLPRGGGGAGETPRHMKQIRAAQPSSAVSLGGDCTGNPAVMKWMQARAQTHCAHGHAHRFSPRLRPANQRPSASDRRGLLCTRARTHTELRTYLLLCSCT